MLSKDEWMRIEEASAAAKRGERRASWHAFKRWHAGWVGICIAAGSIGLACWWVWSHAIRPLFSLDLTGPGTHASLPIAFWVVTVLAILGIGWAFHPRLIPLPAHLLIIRAFVSLLVVLGLGVFALSYLAL